MLRQAHMVGSVTAEGEIIEGVYAVIPARRKNGFSKGWYAMGTEPTGELIDLMITRKLQARDLMTLLAMLEALDLENFIRVSQTHLAERLQMKAPNVSRSIKALVTNGILLTGPKVGKSTTYRLSPEFGWKGGAKQHHAALLAKRMEAANIRGIVTRDPNTVDFINEATDTERER